MTNKYKISEPAKELSSSLVEEFREQLIAKAHFISQDSEIDVIDLAEANKTFYQDNKASGNERLREKLFLIGADYL